MSFDPKETFRNPIQIGMLVNDLETTLERLEKIFGIGPFRIVDFPPEGYDDVPREYKGVPGDFAGRFCFFDWGNIEFEVIQPTHGTSAWSDWLDEHGPGLHHIKFSVPTHALSREYLAENGIDILQKGASVGKNAGKEWVFYDTEDLIGFTIETMNEIVK